MDPATRPLALFLVLTLGLPAPAFALRARSAGLEEKSPVTEELGDRLLATPLSPAAGLEEDPYGHFRRLALEEMTRLEIPEHQYALVDQVVGGDLHLGMLILDGATFQKATGIIFRHLKGDSSADLLFWVEGELLRRERVKVEEFPGSEDRLAELIRWIRFDSRPYWNRQTPTIGVDERGILRGAVDLFAASVKGPHYLKMLSQMVEERVLVKNGFVGEEGDWMHLFQTRDGLWEIRTRGTDLEVYAGSIELPGDHPIQEGPFVKLAERVDPAQGQRRLTVQWGVMEKRQVEGGYVAELRPGRPVVTRSMEGIQPQPGAQVWSRNSPQVDKPWFRSIEYGRASYGGRSGTLQLWLAPGKEEDRMLVDTRFVTPRRGPQPYGAGYQDPDGNLGRDPQAVELWLVDPDRPAQYFTGKPGSDAGLEEARVRMEQAVRTIGDETIGLLTRTDQAVNLAEEVPHLEVLLRAAGYSGIARLVPAALLPGAQQAPTATIFVRGKQKDTVEGNLRGKPGITLTEDIHQANLVISDSNFDPELRSQYLAARRGAFLEVNREDVAERLTLEFLTNLQMGGLLAPGAVLFLDRVVTGGFGEAVLLFA